MQRTFSIINGLTAFLLFCLILFVDRLLWRIPDRPVLPPAIADVRYEPIRLEWRSEGPLKLHGAWTVAVDDPRFGGLSALVIDGSELLALSDSGVLFRLSRPGSSGAARVRELPAGPGDPRFDRNRDSEALLRDPAGRGWWVAFENRHELWLYDHAFERALARVSLAADSWPVNSGIEAMALDDGALLLFPELGGAILRKDGAVLRPIPISGALGRISAAAFVPGRGLHVVERRLTPRGFANAIVRLEPTRSGYRVAQRLPLDLGPFDNVEALEVEPRPGGGTRLWLMSDDNFQRPMRSILLGVDVGNR